MLYLLGGLSLLIQILALLHVIRTGREQIWIWIILIGSLLGCTAYFAFEIMPELFGPGSRFAEKAQAKIADDPVRKLNAAEAEVARTDTAASRMALGEAYSALNAHDEAAFQFRTALDRMNGNDATIETKLAQALFAGGRYGEALASLDRVPLPLGVGEADRLTLLRARLFAELGRREEAATLYTDIVTRLPGAEPRCLYAALLIELGREAEARNQLEALEQRITRHPPGAEEQAMIDWAKAELRRLRAASIA